MNSLSIYIKEQETYELDIKKSKFIAKSFYINDITLVMGILNELKLNYHSASHFPYAYILNGHSFMSDDQEPSHSAGSSILKEINKYNLNNILIVVIRYFGGIKLGVSNLSKAFSSVTSALIEQASKYSMKEVLVYEIGPKAECESKFFNYLALNNIKILNISYDNSMMIKVENINIDEVSHLINTYQIISTNQLFTKLES